MNVCILSGHLLGNFFTRREILTIPNLHATRTALKRYLIQDNYITMHIKAKLIFHDPLKSSL